MNRQFRLFLIKLACVFAAVVVAGNILVSALESAVIETAYSLSLPRVDWSATAHRAFDMTENAKNITPARREQARQRVHDIAVLLVPLAREMRPVVKALTEDEVKP